MKRGATLLPMLLVFGLACVLGAVFNNASPLGVHEVERAPVSTNAFKLAAGPQSNATQRLPSSVITPPAPVLPTTPPAPPAVAVATNPLPPVPPAAPAPIGNVTWAQTKAQLADGRTVLVDARLLNFFEAGHIPNAVSLPANSGGEVFAAFVAKYPPATTPVIAYCSANSCHLSQALAVILTTQHGYADVKVMSGGYEEYQRAEAAPPAEPK